MSLRSPDPSIPKKPYDPDAPNPGLYEIARQEEFGEEPDWGRAIAVLNKSQGNVYENGQWVMDEPYSQRTWAGDGA